MSWKEFMTRGGKGNWIKMGLAAGIALVLIKIFVPQNIQIPQPEPDKPFSMKTCLETVPEDVKGFKIIEGSRSRASIINEMVPIVCKARSIFEKMRTEGTAIESGSMVVQVAVEYNGEVISVRIQASDISYRPFRNKVIDMIADSDFTSWQPEDIDTVFLYPIHLSQKD